MEFHGWRTFLHPLFERQLERLTRQVERLESRDPKGYGTHPATKILATINYYIREAIPLQPQFWESPSPRRWHQARLHGRYWLFYRISRERKVVIYVWLRNGLSPQTGPFGAFRSMLERGNLT